jgi:hypothetical protein
MKQLLDVVNFNADASCLPAASWLAALSGGARSRVCQWLQTYVQLGRKVVLGIVGATVADLRALNPEAIALINSQPQIFELILRPFAHDVALLRTPAGFLLNFSLGRQVIEQTFRHVTPVYLPPEFMMSNSQVFQAERAGATALFINADRFSPPVQRSIPAVPYRLKGALGSTLPCIPLRGELTRAYLQALHEFGAASWNQALQSLAGELLASWRDGESWFFVPDGEARERAWLAEETPLVQRVFVRDLLPGWTLHEPPSNAHHGWCYPVHSFAEWFKESRMLGYLNRLSSEENRLPQFGPLETALWLQAINSDVLSSVEKDSPLIRINDAPGESATSKREWRIWRSARGFEGEEFLSLLEHFDPSFDVERFVRTTETAHLQKLRARLQFIEAAAS